MFRILRLPYPHVGATFTVAPFAMMSTPFAMMSTPFAMMSTPFAMMSTFAINAAKRVKITANRANDVAKGGKNHRKNDEFCGKWGKRRGERANITAKGQP